MFRPIFTVVLSVGVLFSIATAIDVSKTKKTDVWLTNDDIVPKTQLKQLAPNAASGPVFIGDVEAGVRYPNELVFTRILQFNNPVDKIQTTTTYLRVSNARINYVSVVNDPGSYVVSCVDESTLQTQRVDINFRVPPNSRSQVTIVVAAHEN